MPKAVIWFLVIFAFLFFSVGILLKFLLLVGLIIIIAYHFLKIEKLNRDPSKLERKTKGFLGIS